jgi:trigger factor
MAKLKKTAEDQKEISKSKAKRTERKKEVAKKKRSKLITRIVWTVIAVAIVALIVFYVGKKLYLAAIRTTSITNFSEGLSDDGKIDGLNVSDYITLVDYKNISIPEDEVAATDEEVDEDINSTLEQYEYVSDDTSLTIADEDKVNIDYVGTIDGEEFDGGNSNGEGVELTIGSGTMVDDFEEQLIGAHPGDVLTVEVTFPEDYSDADVAGLDAEFEVTINGIVLVPELTDEFVTENIELEDVTTADEYRAYVENNYYEEHLEDYLTNYIVENSTVKSYPKNYLKIVKGTTKYNDEYMMSYYSQMFASYGMTGYGYDNLWDYAGVSDEYAYEKDLTDRAKETVKTALVYQAIFEDAGLSLDIDTMLANLDEENGEGSADSMVESYGQGYLAQDELHNIVTDYLVDMYK